MSKNVSNPKLKAVSFDPSRFPKTNLENKTNPENKTNKVNDNVATKNTNSSDPVIKKNSEQSIEAKPVEGKIIFPSQTDSKGLSATNPNLRSIQAQRNSAVFEATLLKSDLKKQKIKTWKIVIPISLILVAAVATATPFLVSYVNDLNKDNANLANFNTIKKTSLSSEWKIFVQNELKPISVNPAAMQAKIDENQSSWKSWINPESVSGEINNDAIKSIRSVDVIATTKSPYKISFDVEFQDYIKFHQDYDGSAKINENLFELIDISWKVNAVQVMQQVVDDGQPYTSPEAVQVHLRKPASIETIKTAINNGDKIETLDFVVTGNDNSYTIATTHTLKSIYMANEELTIISNIATSINVDVNWNNQTIAKNTIQTIIGNNPYASLDAVVEKLQQPDNNEQIKAQLSNAASIVSLQFTLTGDNNNYSLNTSITFKPGYTTTNILPTITNLNANLLVNIAWNDINLAKTTIQSIVGTKGYINVSAIKIELERESNQSTIISQITNSSRINSISFTVTQVAINNYTITSAVVMKNGYTSIANLAPITQIQANLTAALSWTNVANVKTSMETIMTNANVTSIIEMQDSLNNDATTLIGMISNGDKINTITFQAQSISGLKFRITSSVTMKPGYAQSGTLAPIEIDYKYRDINISWINENLARQEIQSIVGTSSFEDYNALKARLEQPENLERIKTQINDADAINTLTFEISFNQTDRFIITPSYTLKPGFQFSGTLNPIKNIYVTNMRIGVVWRNESDAKKDLQSMINSSRITNLNELKTYFNSPTSINRIKLWITHADKILAMEVDIVEVEANGTYTISIINVELMEGFSFTDQVIYPITGLAKYTPSAN